MKYFFRIPIYLLYAVFVVLYLVPFKLAALVTDWYGRNISELVHIEWLSLYVIVLAVLYYLIFLLDKDISFEGLVEYVQSNLGIAEDRTEAKIRASLGKTKDVLSQQVRRPGWMFKFIIIVIVLISLYYLVSPYENCIRDGQLGQYGCGRSTHW